MRGGGQDPVRAASVCTPGVSAQWSTCARDASPSFRRMWLTCVSAVRDAIRSSAAIWWFVNPRAISIATSRSRAVNIFCCRLDGDPSGATAELGLTTARADSTA